MSFFGNSGVKFINDYDNTNKPVWTEVQIFDTTSLYNVIVGNTTQFQDSCDYSRGSIKPVEGYCRDDNGKTDSDEYICFDLIENFITGACYNKTGASSLLPVSNVSNLLGNNNTENALNLELDFSRDSSNSYLLTVSLNNSLRFENIWSDTICVTRNEWENNPYVYLQSHWGSGVRFSNLRIE